MGCYGLGPYLSTELAVCCSWQHTLWYTHKGSGLLPQIAAVSCSVRRSSSHQLQLAARGCSVLAAVAEKQMYCRVCMTRCCADMLLLLREQQALAVQATFSPPCPRTELPPARTAGSNSRLRGVA